MSGLSSMTMGTMLRDRCGSTSSAESSSLSSQPSSPPDCGAMEDPRRLRQSNSSRYKTELCRAFEEYGTCKYGEKCQFAHGMAELRSLCRHPKYKTELCRTFHTEGFCPYGKRCHFVHTPKEELGQNATEMKLSPLEPYAMQGSESVFLPENFSPISHLPSPPAPRIDYYDPLKRSNQLMFQQQDYMAQQMPYRNLGNELKRWSSQQATPNYNRRTAAAQIPPPVSDWQTAQALRNVLNLTKNSRLPVFSGLGTA
ncbi:mRNA decay activator protein ZFP36L2-like [Bolinopsis microptera]|uniref:mRNA decay activator protein ZFP36L2-like n=1 Tax=Bolinopsis microptera TaxID=2820187 RepID=UPI003079E7AE